MGRTLQKSPQQNRCGLFLVETKRIELSTNQSPPFVPDAAHPSRRGLQKKGTIFRWCLWWRRRGSNSRPTNPHRSRRMLRIRHGGECRKKAPSSDGAFGGDEEDRTLDLTDANRTLSQLSYAPNFCGGPNSDREIYYSIQWGACQYKIPNYGGNFDASGRTDGPLNAPRASAAPLPRSLPKRASPRRGAPPPPSPPSA